MPHPTFAPMLYINSGIKNIDFYKNAFGGIELRRWSNNDGSIHAAELSIHGNMFHLHEEKLNAGHFSPKRVKGTTTAIGLFVDDVDAVMQRAIAAGAIEITPAQNYDYGYRQGEIIDPFGHMWMIEKKI